MENIGLKRGYLEIMDYQENYPIIYEKEKDELLKIYGDKIFQIDHVGSTSIKGIKSKPIIDILIQTNDLDDFQGHFYCQVHHKNGDKLNNRTNNLICLCVACHSNVDARHKDNFSTKANQELLKSFEKYKKENNKQVDVPQQYNPLSVESRLQSLFKLK